MPVFDGESFLAQGQAEPPESRRSRYGEVPFLFPILAGVCAVLIAILSVYPVAGLFIRVSNDFGEGWNAYWAQAVQKGLPLYSTARPFVANNYPPLSFYANAALGNVIGDNIFAGRLIALTSMIGVAALIGRIVAMFGAPARWAWMSAAIFLLYNLVYLRQMVAVDNPQWLGELIGLASLLPLLSRQPSALRDKDVGLAAATMVVAGLVKHNQFALPLAITTWLLLCNRRALVVWCVSGLGFVAIACASLFALYGPAVFVEILHFQRTMSLPTFVSGLAKLAAFAALIGVAALSLRWQRGNPHARLLLLYALFGVVLGVLQRLGSGVYINAFDDALIGLTLSCGTFLGLAAPGRHARPLGSRGRAALLVILLLPILIVAPKHVMRSTSDVRDLRAQEAIWRGMIADVRAARGPVFCELPAVCYWAGKPLLIDFFAYGQKLRLGADPRPLLRMIASRDAGLLVIDHDAEIQESERRLPPPFSNLIDANYRITRLAANHVATMVPREMRRPDGRPR